jgi:crotonobetainyl-CoA:carnitine CoA-transferase CaiB-like acyl-CoA transferase
VAHVTPPSRPLDGVRVLDLSRLLPGPFASLVLADLGARVDKIEDPQGGDYLRLMPPMIGDQSGMFLALNRNKRSAVLDLKKPEAQAALLKMVERYDVLLEQFRPGVLDRLGLSHATLRAKNPRLVVCALTGYGQDGPLAKAAGHDLNYLARSGVLGFQGPPGAPPTVPGFQLADISGGLYSVVGILAALQLRAKTGEGSVVDVSMVESAMGFAVAGFGALFAGHTPSRGAEPLAGGIAPYNTYLSKDEQPITIGALEPKFWQAFCAGTGLETNMGALVPGPHQAEMREKVAAVFRTKTRAEWQAFAREADCCLEAVLTPAEATTDEHLRARGVFFDMDSPWGKLKQMRTPVTPRDATHAPPPRQGEHTDVILREAGFSDDEIATLKQRGATK